MNICIIGSSIPPDTGGVQVYTYELASSLAKAGNNVYLFGYRTKKNYLSYEEKDGIKIVRISNIPGIGNKLYFLTAYLSIKQLHKKVHFDIIHAQSALPSGLIALFMKEKFGIPYILTSHGFDIIVRSKQIFLRSLIRKALLNAYRVIGVSNEMRDLSIKAGAEKSRTLSLPNAVDTDLFAPAEFNNRSSLGLPGDSLVILALRRLVPKTGIQYLIRIAPSLIRKYPKVHFLIIGNGPLQQEFISTVAGQGLSANFSFLGDIPNHEIPAYINVSDISVFPSLAEATSIACLEVMSCAKAVVASNVGGLPEIIKDRQTGLLVDFERTDSTYEDYGLSDNVINNLEQAISDLLNDKKLRVTLGNNARQYIINNFSWKLYCSNLLHIYNQALLK